MTQKQTSFFNRSVNRERRLEEAHLARCGRIHKSLMEKDSFWDEFLRKHLSTAQRQEEEKETQNMQFSGKGELCITCDLSGKGHLRTA